MIHEIGMAELIAWLRDFIFLQTHDQLTRSPSAHDHQHLAILFDSPMTMVMYLCHYLTRTESLATSGNEDKDLKLYNYLQMMRSSAPAALRKRNLLPTVTERAWHLLHLTIKRLETSRWYLCHLYRNKFFENLSVFIFE
jgi:hypothetical protein